MAAWAVYAVMGDIFDLSLCKIKPGRRMISAPRPGDSYLKVPWGGMGSRKNGSFGSGSMGNQRWLGIRWEAPKSRCLGRTGHPPKEWGVLPSLILLKWSVPNRFRYFTKMSLLLLRWPSASITPAVTYPIPPCFIVSLLFYAVYLESHQIL